MAPATNVNFVKEYGFSNASKFDFELMQPRFSFNWNATRIKTKSKDLDILLKTINEIVMGMPNIPDEQKPAIGKVIAPAALFWFRWAAVATIITGLLVAYFSGYAHEAMTLGIGSGGGKNAAIGIGMWLGLIMAFNVWFIICKRNC